MRLCEEKVRVTRRWIQAIRQEINEFDGQVARLNNYLETDIPRAAAALERMVTALEKYAGSVQTGSFAPGPATARASFYIYNTRDEVDSLVSAVEATSRMFGTG